MTSANYYYYSFQNQIINKFIIVYEYIELGSKNKRSNERSIVETENRKYSFSFKSDKNRQRIEYTSGKKLQQITIIVICFMINVFKFKMQQTK